MSAASLAIVAPLQPNARPSQKPVPIDDEYAVRIVEHKRGSHHPMRHCAQYYAQEIRYRTLRRLPRPSTNQSCGRPREAAYPRKASTCPLGSCSRESNPPTTILPTSRTPTVARFGGRPTAATAAACLPWTARRSDRLLAQRRGAVAPIFQRSPAPRAPRAATLELGSPA
jgi:hypothetical protein